MNEPMVVVDATGTTTTMTRDIWGNITNLNQSSGLNGYTVNVDRKFWYDNRFRLCRHRAPEFGDELFAYDNANQLTMSSRGEAAGSTCGTPSAARRIAFTYDAMGRQTLINFPSGTPDISKTYDANGNVLTTNRGGVNWTYFYNELDLMTKENLTIDGRSYLTTHGYDNTGYHNASALPGSVTISYDPNGFGEPRAVRQGATNYVSNISYHPNGTVSSATHRNTKTFTQSLTPRQQIYEIKVDGGIDGLYVHRTHTYDARGKITLADDHHVNQWDKTYGYDARGRLTTANGPWGTGSYTYDGLDNIRQKTLGSRVVDLEYNASKNRILRVKDSAGTNQWHTYGFDSLANITWDARGQQTITYDWASQPVAMVGSGISNTYTYDGNLKRVKSVQNGKVTYWVYSALTGTPIFADEDTDNVETIYLSGGGVQVRIKNGSDQYTYSDHQGSPIVTTNSAAARLWWEDYTPFGEKRLDPPGNKNDIGYTGHVMDDVSGLTYMQARYYDPVIGRFLSIDPIGYRDGLNVYAYVKNDPVNATDPTGLCDGCFSGAAQQIGGRSLEDTLATDTANSDILNSFLPGAGLVEAANQIAAGNFSGAAISLATELPIAKPLKALKKLNPCSCFVAGTLVETEHGLRPIEEIEIGDKVWAWSEETGDVALKEVTDLIRPEPKPIWALEVSGVEETKEKIEVTDDHPWWVIGIGWVETKDLSPGMALSTRDGKGMIVTSTAMTDRQESTFNLTIAEYSTFFVSEDAILVHNCPIHGNSAASMKPQHRYEIYDTKTGDVKKTGISGAPLNQNGTSPRANSQVNRLNRADDGTTVAARVVETDIPGRRAALDAERAATNELSRQGNSLELQRRPQPD
ncbi:MAG: RHS repeat-associated core domain-containing protein [Pseudomonadota bacterium]